MLVLCTGDEGVVVVAFVGNVVAGDEEEVLFLRGIDDMLPRVVFVADVVGFFLGSGALLVVEADDDGLSHLSGMPWGDLLSGCFSFVVAAAAAGGGVAVAVVAAWVVVAVVALTVTF